MAINHKVQMENIRKEKIFPKTKNGYCVIGGSTDAYLNITSAYGTYLEMPFNETIIETETIKRDGNKIKIVGDISAVEIGGTFNTDSNSANFQIFVIKNSSTVFVFDSGTINDMVNIVFPKIIISCQKNDLIYIKVGASKVNNFLLRRERSFLSVKEI